MSLQQIIQEKRQDILHIAASHGAFDIRIFGSAARGDDGECSDVDFLIKLEKDRSLLDHAAMVVDLEDLLNRKVDVITESGIKERLKKRILSEAVPL